MFYKFILLIITFSCGKAKDSDDQTLPRLKAPDFPTTAKTNLTSAGLKLQSYSGALLIWHEAVTATQILPIGEGTKNSRLAKAKVLKFERDVHDPYVLGLKNKIQILTAEIQTQSESLITSNKSNLKQSFANWFENSVTELEKSAKISNAEKDRALKLFGMFCESQIIAFASDSNLALVKYKERPTPNQICEKYFAQKKLLQGPSCENPPTAAGKSFFTCLWQEGVARTLYFERISSLKIGTDTRAAILKKWTDSPESYLAKFLENAKDKSGLILDVILNAKSFDEDYDSLAVNAGDSFKEFQRREFGDLFFYEPPKAIVDNWFEKAVPKDAILAVFNSKGKKDLDLNFFGAKNLELHGTFSKPFADFRKSTAETLSANDYLFNDHRTEVLPAAQKEAQGRIIDNVSKIPQFKPFFVSGNAAELQKKRTEVEGLKSELIKPKTEAERKALNNSFLTTQIEARVSVTAPNAAKAFFLNSTFELKSDNKILDIKYQFSPKAPAIVARWNLEQKVDMGCSAAIGANQLCAEVLVDLEQSYIQLKRIVREPELEGFEFQSSSGMDAETKKQGFNDMPPRDLRNRNFTIEAYQNRIDDVMDYFSVETKFCELQNSDKCLWKGAMTLLP